jgi:hypothetical protein
VGDGGVPADGKLLSDLIVGGAACQKQTDLSPAVAAARVAQISRTIKPGQLIALGGRFAYELGHVAVIAAAGIGVFLALDYWPDVIERIVLAYLLAFIVVLFARTLLRILLSPTEIGTTDLRLVPMDADSAGFWTRRLALLVSIFAFGYATVLSLTLARIGTRRLTCVFCQYPLKSTDSLRIIA